MIPLHIRFLRHPQQRLVEMAFLFSLGALAGVKAKRLELLRLDAYQRSSESLAACEAPFVE
jgi:hypothetical protein